MFLDFLRRDIAECKHRGIFKLIFSTFIAVFLYLAYIQSSLSMALYNFAAKNSYQRFARAVLVWGVGYFGTLCFRFMVLYRASYSSSPSGLYWSPTKGFVNFEAYYYITPLGLPVKVCKACQENMASIPPSAFSAAHIRETQRDMKVSNIRKGDEPTQYFRTKLMELSPLKYNSKLMNSIWGFYNRYSPHNVKKINDAFTFNEDLQQSAANSSNKNESKINLPAAKLDNVWTINVSQSH